MSSCYLRYTTYDLAQHRRTMERNVIRRRARSGPVPSATKSLLGDLPTDSSLDEWSSYRFLDSETGYPRWLQQPCGEGLVEWSSRLHNPLSSKKQLPPPTTPNRPRYLPKTSLYGSNTQDHQPDLTLSFPTIKIWAYTNKSQSYLLYIHPTK